MLQTQGHQLAESLSVDVTVGRLPSIISRLPADERPQILDIKLVYMKEESWWKDSRDQSLETVR
jgi:hypothetical protein